MMSFSLASFSSFPSLFSLFLMSDVEEMEMDEEMTVSWLSLLPLLTLQSSEGEYGELWSDGGVSRASVIILNELYQNCNDRTENYLECILDQCFLAEE